MTKFNGAVIILTDSTLAAEYAEKLAKTYSFKEYQYIVSESTPDNVPESTRETITKLQSELGIRSEVLTVYPTA